MIAFLSGSLTYKGLDYLLIDVCGVGYKVAMSARSLEFIGSVGDDILVHTQLILRENEISLYGFSDISERDVFLKLIEVTGVGPKVALSALSTLSVDTLVRSIVLEDIATISSIPGIGKKTAQRIALDLKDKFSPLDGSLGMAAAPSNRAVGGEQSALSDAQSALLAMDFSAIEISEALLGASDDMSAEKLIAYALRRLGA
ncbi:MAG: Holliday junction branch migration protein RuvA [Coriobacteriia bacterium]|nr:Holliday junction branch migration protein RuvA [Coriobacteriia bacterium]